jgi:3-isopropylmalate dehydratase small subunit
LPALEIPELKGKINQRDELKIDLTKLVAENTRTSEIFRAKEVPQFLRQMLLNGGLVEYYKKYKQFPWIKWQ